MYLLLSLSTLCKPWQSCCLKQSNCRNNAKSEKGLYLKQEAFIFCWWNFYESGKGRMVKKKNQHKCQHLTGDHSSFASCTDKFSRAVTSCHPVSPSSSAAPAIYSSFTSEHLLRRCIKWTNQTVLQQLGRRVFSVAQCLVVLFYVFFSFQQVHLLWPPCL